MEEIYKKIINGEINIKYLSPIDLINLEIYLEQINVNLKDFLNKAKEKNIELENKKTQLQNEIMFEEDII